MAQQHGYSVALLAAGLLACGGGTPPRSEQPVEPPPPPMPLDSAQAVVIRDSAEATLAALVEQPSRARFDSVRVVQPPFDGTRWPAAAVCGRLAGLPGRGEPARFVYQSRWTVFVEDTDNVERFGELWQRTCGDAEAVVLLGG